MKPGTYSTSNYRKFQVYTPAYLNPHMVDLRLCDNKCVPIVPDWVLARGFFCSIVLGTLFERRALELRRWIMVIIES